MLRHPDACSPIETSPTNASCRVIPDTEGVDAKRVLICTGKIGHELRLERQKRKDQKQQPLSSSTSSIPSPKQSCSRD